MVGRQPVLSVAPWPPFLNDIYLTIGRLPMRKTAGLNGGTPGVSCCKGRAKLSADLSPNVIQVSGYIPGICQLIRWMIRDSRGYRYGIFQA